MTVFDFGSLVVVALLLGWAAAKARDARVVRRAANPACPLGPGLLGWPCRFEPRYSTEPAVSLPVPEHGRKYELTGPIGMLVKCTYACDVCVRCGRRAEGGGP